LKCILTLYSFNIKIWFGNSNYGRSVKIHDGKDSRYVNYPFYSISPVYIEDSKLKMIEVFYDSVLNVDVKDIDIYNSLNKYSLKNEVIIVFIDINNK